ncbi:MAG TPA: WS/DGAT domain-containing protein, partial [Anaerolineae bacterium]
AVMTRLHHCIADGIALVYVLLSITDLAPDAPLSQPEVKQEKEPGGGLPGPLGALFKQATAAAGTARKVTTRLVSEGLETLVNPTHALELALQGTDSAVATSRLVLRSPDPKTIFKGPLGVAKRVTWSRPLPLAHIKAIKNVTGGTVNDVLVSVMTGALQRYLLGRGENVEGLNFRAAIPVNLRTPEEMGTLGNKFGLVFLSLPVGIADPLERLAEVRRRMNALKHSQEAIVAFGILNAIGMTPNDVQATIVKMFGAKATAVLTNVPGPTIPLYLAGSEISGFMFWVPQSGRVGLGISILSYAGRVFLGVVTDKGLVPDPDTIIDGCYEEYEALMALVQEAEQADTTSTSAAR